MEKNALCFEMEALFIIFLFSHNTGHIYIVVDPLRYGQIPSSSPSVVTPTLLINAWKY